VAPSDMSAADWSGGEEVPDSSPTIKSQRVGGYPGSPPAFGAVEPARAVIKRKRYSGMFTI